MTNKRSTYSNVLVEAIEKHIRDAAQDIYEVKKRELIDKLDKEKDMLLASITLKFMKAVRINDFGDTVRIELSTESLKKEMES